ncbi:hypothetical protein [Salinactinospora qingdaonensis]|uniref:Low temperature requirement A protein (LtrA) n=1 Tax=Salinactinospora qingdaonensis TaxID=702744 RepID=A0ABP7FE12_9ACTN
MSPLAVEVVTLREETRIRIGMIPCAVIPLALAIWSFAIGEIGWGIFQLAGAVVITVVWRFDEARIRRNRDAQQASDES